MKLFCIGINHKTAPVELREKISFGPHEIVSANSLLKQDALLEEALILSTCNRMEIYAVAQEKNYINIIKKFLSSFHNIDISKFEDKLYVYSDEEAVKHIFKVASSLDSMIVGEVEILGQVKKAYHQALASKTIGKVLNKLFQKSFNAAKRVRSNTFIAKGAVSVTSAAIRLAKKILGDLKDKKVLIAGAGKIGEQLISYLKKNGLKSIFVANRTFEKANILASRFKAHAIDFENLINTLIDVDIIIASTSAPHHIIHKKDILELMPKRKQKPLFIIDLAVPRDVDEDVNKIDNVYLYDIDDLQKIVDGNITLRQDEIDNCEKIINHCSQKFMEWLNETIDYRLACK